MAVGLKLGIVTSTLRSCGLLLCLSETSDRPAAHFTRVEARTYAWTAWIRLKPFQEVHIATKMTSMYSDAPSIKVDPAQSLANGQDPHIKPDPEALGASPGPQLEDDIYEDTGDLEFAGAESEFYLTKLPKFLWETWSKLDDNQEVQIGTIRVEGGLQNLGSKNSRVWGYTHQLAPKRCTRLEEWFATYC